MSKSRGRPFQPGNTNGHGRPPGSLNKTNEEVHRLFVENSPELAKKLIQLGRDGNTKALIFSIEQALPPRQNNPVPFEMPEVRTLADILPAGNAILQAYARREITSDDLERLMAGLAFLQQCLENLEIPKRLQALEEQAASVSDANGRPEDNGKKPRGGG